MIKNLKLLTVMFLALAIQSCSNDDDEYVMQPKTIYEHVATSNNYTSLTYALQKTNLDGVLNGTDNYTLYAPNNMAFSRFLMEVGFSNVEQVPTELLTQILLNHVMAGEIQYRDFETGYFQTAANSAATGTPLSIHIEQVNMRVTLNGESRITQGNVYATNGVIHAVDRVV